MFHPAFKRTREIKQTKSIKRQRKKIKIVLNFLKVVSSISWLVSSLTVKLTETR
jgi:hypothetical protein